VTETIMPCFDRYPEEGNLIGRLLAGYGELEIELCNCVSAITGNLDDAIKALFSERGEYQRIMKANKMARNSYVKAGLGVPYGTAIQDMHFCREVRNQYAHCTWFDTPDTGLCFIDLEAAANSNNPTVPLTLLRQRIDLALLEEQQAFFRYVQKCWWFLASAYPAAHGKSSYPHKLPQPSVRPSKFK
jgi:hypothetical protein